MKLVSAYNDKSAIVRSAVRHNHANNLQVGGRLVVGSLIALATSFSRSAVDSLAVFKNNVCLSCHQFTGGRQVCSSLIGLATTFATSAVDK